MSDLISRTAFKNKYLCFGYLPEMSEKEFDRFPTVDAEPVVHGQWDEERFAFCNVCSNCGLVIDRTSIKMHSGKFNYCPNCGAKMKKGDEYNVNI